MAPITRRTALRHRFAAQGLTAAPGTVALPDAPVLDVGVQDTGPDGALWALAARGVGLTGWPDGLALAWTVRGAPHAYRRTDLPDVARAVVPYSEKDAGKRIYDAAAPLRAAGLMVAAALDTVAAAMRRIVGEPTVKGDVSTRLTAELPAPFLRWCRSCGATHAYEMPFRLAALHAGLALEPGTSPPVLAPVPRWPTLPSLAEAVAVPPQDRGVPERLDLVFAYVRLLGPARAVDVAAYLDAPVADVRAVLSRLEAAGSVTTVEVEGEPRLVPVEAADGLARADDGAAGVVRLVGPYDLFLQARDRDLLVPDRSRHRALWAVLGRPGAVLVDGEVVGTWRPRASGRRLTVAVDAWEPWDARVDAGVDEQIDRLADLRGLESAGRA